MQAFLGLGTVATAIGLIVAVWAWKMTAWNANVMLAVAWVLLSYSAFSFVPFIAAQPQIPRSLWTLIAAGVSGLALYSTLWTPSNVPAQVLPSADVPRAEPRERAPSFEPTDDPERRFIRDAIGELVYELRQVSGREFRSECTLLESEQLTPAKPSMALFALTPNAKFTVVPSLNPVVSALAGVEGSFLFQQNPENVGGRRVKDGYEKVAEEYNSLLGKRWVIAATRYKDGEPLTGNETFNTCVYGLRSIDESAIEALLDALEAAEAVGVRRMRRFLQADPPSFVAHAEVLSERPVIARGGRIILDVTDDPEARLGDVYDPSTHRFKRPLGG